MIYECPNCQTPQEAGQTVCPNCRAEFDGPVPSDAIVPPADSAAPADAAGIVSEEATVYSGQTAASGEAEPGEAEPGEAGFEAAAPPAGETVLPAAAPSPLVEVPAPANPPAFPPVQSYTPPPDTPPPPRLSEPPFGKLSRVLWIAFPVVLVLVLGGIFYSNSLNSDADTAPVPLPAVHSSAPAVPPPTAPATAPNYLQGGGNTNSTADDPRIKMLAGRWESKSGDYYVFNSDGTGSHGSPAKQQPEQTFLWGLVQNRVMLYRDKNEMLRFNAGPDDDTIFLAGETGSYVQYSRSKTT